ncbi:hypothetical protein [Rhodoluna limnophila]|uniref:hypothetical protein n=1 Tax=Rhodoluna limnophila TaxID=232537 RepID=UPI0011061229|nr:hypothetical protein [Rhodoluna limnophila]
MSTLRLTKAPAQTRVRTQQLKAAPIQWQNSRPGMVVVATITIGALAIALLNLLLHIMTSNAVYELAALQQERKELTTTTQILGEEVDSLSSQQNLSNSAQKLGMIANANPVFLRLSDQKVLGKPQEALNTAGRISKNLIANAALTEVSTNLTASVASAEAASATGVGAAKSSTKPVVSNGDAIPASPTH